MPRIRRRSPTRDATSGRGGVGGERGSGPRAVRAAAAILAGAGPPSQAAPSGATVPRHRMTDRTARRPSRPPRAAAFLGRIGDPTKVFPASSAGHLVPFVELPSVRGPPRARCSRSWPALARGADGPCLWARLASRAPSGVVEVAGAPQGAPAGARPELLRLGGFVRPPPAEVTFRARPATTRAGTAGSADGSCEGEPLRIAETGALQVRRIRRVLPAVPLLAPCAAVRVARRAAAGRGRRGHAPAAWPQARSRPRPPAPVAAAPGPAPGRAAPAQCRRAILTKAPGPGASRPGA